MWASYRRAGPRQLVVAGVLLPASRDRYEQGLGLPIRSVRLEADAVVIAARLQGR